MSGYGSTDNGTWSYTYDQADRMVTATGPAGAMTTYGYDGAGNRTSVQVGTGGTTVTTTYDGAGYPVSADDGTTYTVDAWGRTTGVTKGTVSTTYAYDTWSRISSETVASGTTALEYDALDRTMKRTKGTATSRYGYSGLAETLAKITASGTSTPRQIAKSHTTDDSNMAQQATGAAMTLVLSCITKKYVVQVSDRRLTRLDGSLYDDESNKAVVYCGEIAIAYTGFSQLGPSMPAAPANPEAGFPADSGGPKTDWWIAQTLSAAPDFPRALSDLAEAAATEVGKIPLPLASKPHTFVCVGWGRERATPDILRPCIITLSNCIDGSGVQGPVRTTFMTGLHRLNRQVPFRWMAAGQPLSGKERIQLEREIRRSVAKGREPAVIAAVLANAIHRVAESNPRVGKGLMVIAIPISAPPGQGVVSGRPAEGAATFAYLSDSDSSKGLYYAPNTVCGGMVTAGAILSSGPSPLL